MIAAERETCLNYTAADDVARVWSCIAADVRRLKADKRWTQTDGGTYADGTEWGEFTAPLAGFNPAKAAKSSRSMTDEQRQAAALRLAANLGRDDEVAA